MDLAAAYRANAENARRMNDDWRGVSAEATRHLDQDLEDDA